ncbi:MAG: DedA family protein, partial [Candidatus Pelagibacterales bacterium]
MNDQRSNKLIKLLIGFAYLLILSLFLYFFFSNFTLEELRSYQFIQTNRDFFLELRENNRILLFLAIMLFTIIWVTLLGFGTPIALFGGFIFGKWIGTLLVVLSLTLGSCALYLLGKFFFLNIIKENFLSKFKHLESKFRDKEFFIMIIYRIVATIPFGIANLLPVLFDVKLKNYFFGTAIGILPSIFILTSLGSGLEKVIGLNEEMPSLMAVIKSPDIYMPLIGFILIF